MSDEAEPNVKQLRPKVVASNDKKEENAIPQLDSEIEIGDVVLLNSDPVQMTVIGVQTKKDEKIIRVQWFDVEGQLGEATFDPRCLWITRKAGDKHNA
jgi:uncharacterized protein YodC (DUF2158 family)